MGSIKGIKLELALIDDLAKVNDSMVSALKSADSSWKEYQDYLSKASTPYKKMISNYNNLDKATSPIFGLLDKVDKSSKELGIDPKTIAGYSALKQNQNTAKEIFNTISSFKDPSTFQ